MMLLRYRKALTNTVLSPAEPSFMLELKLFYDIYLICHGVLSDNSYDDLSVHTEVQYFADV